MPGGRCKGFVESNAAFTRKGPLTCNPRHILPTLLYRKAVHIKNYEHVRIPERQDMERIACNLNKQLQTLLYR